jgi:hypothetical protein
MVLGYLARMQEESRISRVFFAGVPGTASGVGEETGSFEGLFLSFGF